jgi:hypothetical protein
MPTLVTNILITALQTSKKRQHKFNTIKYPFFQSAIRNTHIKDFSVQPFIGVGAPTLHFNLATKVLNKRN